ncbi:group I truncated hemoglobin [Halococcus saccharolyticus]|nr:group 1 truncated hemoglobin [Halococcus saccharolyticus]
MSESSLYTEIGGRDAVVAVVDDFYDRVLDDDRLAGFFEDTAMDDLRAHQIAFVSSVAGGPVEYTGDDMRAAHAHLDIADEDFDAVAGHLEAALRENGVRSENVAAIVEEVAALRDPIVGR